MRLPFLVKLETISDVKQRKREKQTVAAVFDVGNGSVITLRNNQEEMPPRLVKQEDVHDHCLSR